MAMPKPQKKCKRSGVNKSLNTWPPAEASEVLFLIMDVRHPLQESDLNFIAWCEQYNLSMQILLNKSDKISRNKASQELLKCTKKTAHNLLLDNPMLISARTALGADELSRKILNWMEIS